MTTLEEYNKMVVSRKINWCKSDIKFYSQMATEMKNLIKKSDNLKYIKLLKENIVLCKKEVREARKKLKVLL